MEILVDVREPNEVIEKFKDMFGDDVVTPMMNPVSDIYVPGVVGIERKKPADFISSLTDGRLFKQADELRESFEHPYIVVQGSLTEVLAARRGVHQNAIFGCIASLMGHHNVHVVFTDNYFYQVVKKIIEKHCDEKGEDARRYQKFFKKKEQNPQIGIITGIKGIGKGMAIKLINHFGSVKAIANATEDELWQVDGVGPFISEKIYNAFHDEVEFEEVK